MALPEQPTSVVPLQEQVRAKPAWDIPELQVSADTDTQEVVNLKRPKLKKSKSIWDRGIAVVTATNAFMEAAPLGATHALDNIEEIKAQVSERKHTDRFKVDPLRTSGLAQRIVRNGPFQNFILGTISFYSIWMAVDTDYNDASTLNEALPIFQVMEHLFCAIFTFEWLIKVAAYRHLRYALYDGWFLFDTVLVITGVAETWVLTIVFAVIGQKQTHVGGNYSFRLLRLLRLSRLARTIRLLRSVPELLIMLKGMLAAARSMFLTFVLTLLILYVFGIAMKQSAAGTPAGEQHFSSVGKSMFSLLLFATLLDGPAEVIKGMNEISIVIFLCVIACSAFVLLNMLIGVLCEVVTEVSHREKSMLDEAFVRERVVQVLELLDSDGNGMISKKELRGMAKSPEACALLQEANVDITGLLDIADLIFQSDQQGHEFNKEIDLDTFVKLVISLRGENQATVKDVVDLRKFLNTRISATQNDLQKLTHRLRDVEITTKELKKALNTGQVDAKTGYESDSHVRSNGDGWKSSSSKTTADEGNRSLREASDSEDSIGPGARKAREPRVRGDKKSQLKEVTSQLLELKKEHLEARRKSEAACDKLDDLLKIVASLE
eukprot:TRINITY_DN24913_c0_g1_i1.p1 TRINITY_DN24913_c0_g1~~TRINITY_DN24913_c0_g1_i1.p1  ORF type:complete len:623 (-),score=111.99 TRINITY_DN24913_c0_g1_i1:45-1865(-)